MNKTPTPKPLYPDTPWWSNLVTAVVVATVSILGTMYVLRGSSAMPGSVPGLSAAGILVDTVTYIPHILLLFGVLADMFTYQGVWSIPSLVGFLSIFINYLMQYFWKGLQELWSSTKSVANVGNAPQVAGAPVKGSFFKEYDGCNVQGFEWLATSYAPQTLVVTATVFFYYIFDIVRNRGWTNAAASITMFAVFYMLQAGILQYQGGCVNNPTTDPSHLSQSMMALFEGMFIGGSAYGIVQTYYPNRLPSSVISPFPTKSKNDLTMGPDGKMYDANGYPYVVLPNGNAVPDLSTQQSRDAFAQLAGQNLGSGTPAKPDSCPNA